SKLDWQEAKAGRHAQVLCLYREFLRLRRESAVLRDHSRGNFQVLPALDGVLRIRFGRAGGERWLVLVDLSGGHRMPALEESSWQVVLTSNESRFGGDEGPAFAQPEVRVLRLTTSG
ncbi:MAG: DUF3459 domain-containing protein, partial [Chthoniobacterales bacterium]